MYSFSIFFLVNFVCWGALADTAPNEQGFFQFKRLNNATTKAKCNDGSSPGYYIQESPEQNNTQNWLIFLPGGGFCFSSVTCAQQPIYLLSSRVWPKRRQFGGILSSNLEINPRYHAYNKIVIPYCSGDLWTGNRDEAIDDLYFQGSRILQAVLDDLISSQKLVDIERMVFAGSSAGGFGVLMNIDELARRLARQLTSPRPIHLVGVVESSWIPENTFEPLEDRPISECTSFFICAPQQYLRIGIDLWQSKIPRGCLNSVSSNSTWKCFFGPVVRPHIRSPLFLVQSLFDILHMQLNQLNVLEPGLPEKLIRVISIGEVMTNSLINSKLSVFAPACLEHEMIAHDSWKEQTIGDRTLVGVLARWDEAMPKFILQARERNFPMIRLLWKNPQARRRKYANFVVIDKCSVQEPEENTSCVIPPLPICNQKCNSLNTRNPEFRDLTFMRLLTIHNIKRKRLHSTLGLTYAKFRALSSQEQMQKVFCSGNETLVKLFSF